MQGILHAQTVFADISDGICRYFRRPYVMIPPYSTKTCPWINPFTSTQKTAAKKPVKNDDLWKELDSLVQQHDVRWTWVKGHAGHSENEKADELANQGAAKFA